MMYFVDANVFLRVLVKEGKKSFEECMTFLTAVKQNIADAVTSTLIISEVVWVLGSYYGIKREEIAKMVEGILSLSGMKIVDEYDLKKAVGWYKLKGVKYIDAVVASMPDIRDGEWTIVSYDKDFDKLGVKRVRPGEVEIGAKLR